MTDTVDRNQTTGTRGQLSVLAQTDLLHIFFKRMFAFDYNYSTSDGHKNV